MSTPHDHRTPGQTGPAGHGHGHGPTPERALWVAVVLNAAFLVLEAGVGLWTNSLALLSDAGHMVVDVGALSIALVAAKLATRKPSGGYTFGLGRAPVLGGLANAIVLIVVAVLVGIEAVHRFENPPDLDAAAVLWTGIAGLAVNVGSAWYLARSRDRSVNIRGAMLHLISDAMGSVAAIISAIAIGLFGLNLADPVASLVIAILILVGTWPLLRDTVGILLQRAPAGLDVEAARAAALAHPGVSSVDDFHVWALDDGKPVLSAVVTVNVQELAEATTIGDELRMLLREQFGIEHSTFECRHESCGPPIGGEHPAG